MKIRNISLSTLFNLTLISIIQAQVTIAPTNMFIEGNTRFGTYIVINNSNETQEISIDFTFSYSSSDSAGIRSIVTDDQEIEDQYSIAEYIKAFPDFTLAKDQRQIVRLRLSPPSDLPDGTYWAKLKQAQVRSTTCRITSFKHRFCKSRN